MRRHGTMLVVAACGLALMASCKKKPKDEAKKNVDPMDTMAAIMDAKDPPRRPGMKTDATRPAPRVDAARPAGTGKTITIKRVYPKAGDKRVKAETLNIHFTLDAGGKTMKFVNMGQKEISEEILAAKGNTVTKLKVTFTKQRAVEKMNDKEKKVTQPVEGKTYILELKDGKTVITHEGKPVGEKIAKIVRKEYKTFGKPNRLLESLPATPMEIGKPVPALAEGLKKEINDENQADRKARMRLDHVTIVLTGTETAGKHKLAVFKWSFKMTILQGGKEFMVMHSSGPLKLRMDTGWPVVLNGKGPLDVMGNKGAGAFTATETTTYP